MEEKEGGAFKLNKIAKLAVIIFIVALSSSLVETIWAVYMDGFVHSEVIVGFISASLTLISLLSYFVFIPLIETTDKSKLYGYSLILFAISYALFALNSNFYIFLSLAVIITILHTLSITSFGILVRDKSKNKELSKNEGLIYTFANIAWVIGPLIAGYIANYYGIPKVFIIASVSIFLGFLSFKISKIKDKNVGKHPDTNLFKNFYDFFKNKERLIAYIIGGGVNFWWILIYLFMPLHIIRNGLNDLWIGYFLFAVAFPLILSEYWFSKLAGKIGFKKIFKIGFLSVSLISFVCFFVGNIYVLLGVLVLASFGMAMIEPTTEAYFLDVLKSKKEENRFYGPYNTSVDISCFASKILASVILIFLPFKFLFLFFGLSMFGYFLISFKIKNIIESKRKN